MLYLLKEDGYRILQEDGSSGILLDHSVIVYISLYEDIILNDTSVAMKTMYRSLVETIIVLDVFERTIGKLLTDVVEIVDSIRRSISHLFTEVISIVDLLAKTPIRLFSEVITVVEKTIVFFVSKLMLEYIDIRDSIVKSISRRLTETTILTDIIGFFKRSRGFILGRNKNTETSIGSNGRVNIGKNKDTGTMIGRNKE